MLLFRDKVISAKDTVDQLLNQKNRSKNELIQLTQEYEEKSKELEDLQAREKKNEEEIGAAETELAAKKQVSPSNTPTWIAWGPRSNTGWVSQAAFG